MEGVVVDSEGYVTLHSEAPLEDGEVEVVVNPIAPRPPLRTGFTASFLRGGPRVRGESTVRPGTL